VIPSRSGYWTAHRGRRNGQPRRMALHPGRAEYKSTWFTKSQTVYTRSKDSHLVYIFRLD
jgi:hypothetical protein